MIHARTSLTLHAVTRWDSLVGLGNVPALTFRHNVAALKGRGTGVPILLGHCTSCHSRMNALSGRASNTDGVIARFLLAGLDGITAVFAVNAALSFRDISYRPVKLRMKCIENAPNEIDETFDRFSSQPTPLFFLAY